VSFEHDDEPAIGTSSAQRAAIATRGAVDSIGHFGRATYEPNIAHAGRPRGALRYREHGRAPFRRGIDRALESVGAMVYHGFTGSRRRELLGGKM
jgi:hypothetical protein